MTADQLEPLVLLMAGYVLRIVVVFVNGFFDRRAAAKRARLPHYEFGDPPTWRMHGNSRVGTRNPASDIE